VDDACISHPFLGPSNGRRTAGTSIAVEQTPERKELAALLPALHLANQSSGQRSARDSTTDLP